MLSKKPHKELLALSRAIVQPLLPQFHKGQSGRIAIVGGCEDYTGAPYFAAHSAAVLGCDLSHIVCEKSAATVIKLYLPDLMVHPYLFDTEGLQSFTKSSSELSIDPRKELDNTIKQQIQSSVLPKISSLLERMNAVVVGPGFGRDPVMVYTLKLIIEQIKVLNIPVILDADALYLVSKDPLIISNYKKAVLTPNVVEFQRIASALDEQVELSRNSNSDLQQDIDLTLRISKKLGGVTIVRKGAVDIIVHKDQYCVSDIPGLLRRVGGQGDSLAGALAIFLTWANNYQTEVWTTPELNIDDTTVLACFAASLVVRTASKKAYEVYGRSMQTLNVHQLLGSAYQELFGEK